MNKAKLTALCHKIAKQTGLTFNSIMTYYFLEVILKKLSKSSCANYYIFKGGFLLSNVIGVESRSTVDIDFLFHKQTLSEENVRKQLDNILTESKEAIQFSIQSITAIKESDDYGGYRATILAEKLQTIYSRSFLNSRSKDFYDIYILSKLKKEDIDFVQLKLACERTFSYRDTELDFNNIIELLKTFKNDPTQQQQWQNYSKKYHYTKDISFLEILNEIIDLVINLDFLNKD